MLSRLAFRAGSLAPVLVRPQPQKITALAVVTRSNSTIHKHLENWEKANATYYGPDRDTKNYPIIPQPVSAPPTRLGFIPDTWFTFFYEKTGVTGPYMLGAGLLTFVLSKEMWVVEHGFMEFLGFWTAIYIIAKKYGKGIGEYLDKNTQDYRAKHWDKKLQDVTQGAEDQIAEIEKNIWYSEGQHHLFEAKRENVDLQLENTYRQQLAQVHQQVKRRLDYQMEVENTKRQYEQTHMVNWVLSNVMKSITPQQEKESITKCIADLKSMSAKLA